MKREGGHEYGEAGCRTTLTVEDIQYHLYVLDKVRRGLEDARLHGTLSQQEAEARLSKWLTE